MVRERVKNRVFHDTYLIPTPAEGTVFQASSYFPQPHPIQVDLGCGRGRFLLAHAAANPQLNFLGVDLSLLRLRKIDRRAVAAQVENIRVVNAEAGQLLAALPPQSVSTFYVFFPDPWPKRRHHSRRLVSPSFLDLVFRALTATGTLHLCTDHADYFSAMLRCLQQDSRFTTIEPFLPTEEEKTDFELIFTKQGFSAHRCSFRKSA